MEYYFIAITPRSTLIRISRIFLGPLELFNPLTVCKQTNIKGIHIFLNRISLKVNTSAYTEV